jgi:hypothetical protein
MSVYVFGGEDCTEGEAGTVLGIVGEEDAVGGAFIYNSVYAGHLSLAEAVDGELGRGDCGFLHPCIFAGEVGEDVFGKGDGGAAGGIKFVGMMGLGEGYVIVGVGIHEFGKVFVDGGEEGYTYAEIGRPEQGVSLCGAELLHLFGVLGEPSGAAGDYLASGGKALLDVVIGNGGSGELNRYVSGAESGGMEVLRVVYVNDAYNLMASVQGNLFYHLPHLAVAY